MRIVSGRFKSHSLVAPKGDATRPTSDKVRQAVFNVLEHGIGVAFEGARVLDLFAGSGALGLEALSRGAKFCCFIDDAAPARAALRRNVEALGLTGVSKIWRRDATRLGPVGTMAPFDIIFLDPPYGRGLGEKSLASLEEGGWCAPDAIAVLEEKSGLALEIPPGFETLDERDYGDTRITLLRGSVN
ncbi:Ribosomal RNA small subunit methyltransferase D [Methyloligella halotolerans]|uniref:Ribosomal RNA small subunit methyltransferase D n=1 Tax=Methyloligella halotolerans TaxID=1177755 RepID=A0A1E2RYI9_9HYPH|nr:16S rRNA (guanine(966)-N(2))-methyltransferase RsmD [Methyloligella halotolerans]ODA67212.1 Ribosomal RNA small subunit methyltransferase D [Methyloligella halotolerans]